jgi:hypothetical protein
MSKFTERMRATDRNYGSQQHQRDFVERMDELQRRHPCSIDHEHELPHSVKDGDKYKHLPGCYPAGAVDAVIAKHVRRLLGADESAGDGE